MDYLNDQTSPGAQRWAAFEQVQRVEQYLFGTTYGRPYDQWVDAIYIVRESEQELRKDIAKSIGARLI